MQSEILMIGTELLLGQIDDTNATFIARELAANGINLYQKGTVGDNRERIVGALRNALQRSDAVLCSGGLGPTEDDITRECVAEVLNRPLEYHEEIFHHIEGLFARHGFTITENNKRQAMVPRDGIVVENPHGTAPGLIVDDDQGVVVCMPGVPRELKPMLTEKIIPYLRERFGMGGVIHSRVLKVCALGESRVDHAIGDLITNSQNPTVGVLANPAAVRIRITARADSVAEAEALIDPVDAKVRERLPGLIMGVNEDTLETVVNKLLEEKGWTLAVYETFSGGIIAQRLTAANANRFIGGKIRPQGLQPGENAGQKAVDMAEEVLLDYAANCALGVVADPEAQQTIAAFVTPDGATEWAFGRAGTDERLQLRTAIAALEYVRRYLADPGLTSGPG